MSAGRVNLFNQILLLAAGLSICAQAYSLSLQYFALLFTCLMQRLECFFECVRFHLEALLQASSVVGLSLP